MSCVPERLDSEVLDLLRRVCERELSALEAYQDHPGYAALHALIRAKWLSITFGSYELMHVTGTFTQVPWKLAESDGAVAELQGLLAEQLHPELGCSGREMVARPWV